MTEAKTSASHVNLTNSGQYEFRSKYYGTRGKALFILRTCAIWTVVAFPAILMATKRIAHNRPPETFELIGFAALSCSAAVAQWWAFQAYKVVDRRRVVWQPDEDCLHVFEHRVTRQLLSFGSVVSQLVLPMNDILSYKIVRGRGRFLRLHTRLGFINISNDLLEFQELCDLMTDRLNR